MSYDMIEKGELGSEPTQKGIKQPFERIQPNQERFNETLNKGASSFVEAPDKGTPLDTLRDMQRSPSGHSTLSHEALITQTKETVQQIQQIKEVLATPNVQMRNSARQLLQSKLSHIDESLKVALSKAGIEYSPTEQANRQNRENPIERFLGFLTDGEWQLEHLGTQLETMSQQGKELTAVNMLAIQVKVGQIQQELELFSGLLSKALESVKTIMNIQV